MNNDNTHQVNRAAAAVEAYRSSVKNETGVDFYVDDKRLLLIDILTDIQHWARHEKLDFQYLLAQAEYHYDNEIGYRDPIMDSMKTIGDNLVVIKQLMLQYSDPSLPELADRPLEAPKPGRRGSRVRRSGDSRDKEQ